MPKSQLNQLLQLPMATIFSLLSPIFIITQYMKQCYPSSKGFKNMPKNTLIIQAILFGEFEEVIQLELLTTSQLASTFL